jgi:hypothetical protein
MIWALLKLRVSLNNLPYLKDDSMEHVSSSSPNMSYNLKLKLV